MLAPDLERLFAIQNRIVNRGGNPEPILTGARSVKQRCVIGVFPRGGQVLVQGDLSRLLQRRFIALAGVENFDPDHIASLVVVENDAGFDLLGFDDKFIAGPHVKRPSLGITHPAQHCQAAA